MLADWEWLMQMRGAIVEEDYEVVRQLARERPNLYHLVVRAGWLAQRRRVLH